MPLIDELMKREQNTPKKRVRKPRPTCDLSQKQLLTITEASQVLGVGLTTIKTLITIQKGQPPRLRTVREPNSRIVRITRIDLDAYIKRLRLESGIRI